MSKSVPMPLQVTIDTNVINARGALPAMNKITEWHEAQRVLVSYTREPLEGEITPGSVQDRKTTDYLNQSLPGDDHCFRNSFEKLREIMFPSTVSLNTRQERDIEHLIGAIHHANDFFLTHDGAFLRSAEQISKDFQIQIMTPEDFVERYDREITEGASRIKL